MTDRELIIAAARARGTTWPEGARPRYAEIVRPGFSKDRQALSNAYSRGEPLSLPLRIHLAALAGVEL